MKRFAIKEYISVHGTPIETIKGYNIIGEVDTRDIYYCGDSWAVVARCGVDEETEYFSSLSAARDYANQ